MNTAKKSNATRALVIAMVVMILVSLLNWAVITGTGKTKIVQMDLVAQNGYENTALLYVPKTATEEHPAPAIIMFHGISGNARNHESWAVEFSRRGFVVLSVDWYGNGGTDFNGQALTATDWPALQKYVDYIKSLENVNADNIVIGGHSMGTDPAYFLSARNNPKVCLLCNLISPGVANSEKEVYNGNLLTLTGTADKSSADKNYWDRLGKLWSHFGYNGYGTENRVPTDKMFGSFAEGNAKLVIRQQDMIHEAAFISAECIGNLLNFSQDAIGHDNIPNYIEGTNQIWQWKDVIGLVGMFAFVFFMLTLAIYIITNVKGFQDVLQPMPRNIGLRGKGLALSIVAALVFPLIVLRFGGPIYQLITNIYKSTKLFAGNMQNYGFATVLGINLLGIIMLFVFLKTDGKKQNANLRDLGLTSEEKQTKLDWKLIGKAFLVALIVVAAGWSYLRLQGDILGTDFYCLFFGFRPIPWNKFINYIPYMIFWVLAFIVGALGMNVERRLPSTGNEKKDFIIAVVFNSFLSMIMITIMVFVENHIQIHVVGSNATALSNWGIAICRLWGMPVGMTIAGVGQTYLYRKSGSIWLGAFTMGIICCFAASLYGQFRI